MVVVARDMVQRDAGKRRVQRPGVRDHVAEVEDGDVLSSGEPLTYAYYQNVVKPKPAPKAVEKKIVGWRCKICNYVYEGAELPADYTCPLCGHPAEDFEPVYAE